MHGHGTHSELRCMTLGVSTHFIALFPNLSDGDLYRYRRTGQSVALDNDLIMIMNYDNNEWQTATKEQEQEQEAIYLPQSTFAREGHERGIPKPAGPPDVGSKPQHPSTPRLTLSLSLGRRHVHFCSSMNMLG